MSNLQTQHIRALEKMRDDAAAMLARMLAFNESVRAASMPVPILDVTPCWNIQQYAESALKNLELKARGVSSRIRALA